MILKEYAEIQVRTFLNHYRTDKIDSDRNNMVKARSEFKIRTEKARFNCNYCDQTKS